MIRLSRRFVRSMLIVSIMGLLGCDDAVTALSPDLGAGCGVSAEAHWVRAFGTPPNHADSGLENQSIRVIVEPRFGGEGLTRIRLSNRFGTQPVTFSSAFLGRQLDGAGLAPGSNRPLRFNCQPGLTLAPGEEADSDPVDFAFTAFERLAVSLHVDGPSGPVSLHSFPTLTSYIGDASAGDIAADETGAGYTGTTRRTFYLQGIDVVAPPEASVIAVFGDSISEGAGAGSLGSIPGLGPILGSLVPPPPAPETNYQDVLARRLLAAGLGARYSVVNAAISGNRLLFGPLPGFPNFGPGGLSRLQADVIDLPGVRHAIVLIGTNDLGMLPPATGQQMIEGLHEVVTRLQAAGIRVLLATQTPAFGPIIPIGGHGAPYAVLFREQINQWTRTASGADAVLDFFEVTRSPLNPFALAPAFDSGDNLHLNTAGYQALGDAIDLSLFD